MFTVKNIKFGIIQWYKIAILAKNELKENVQMMF